MRALTRAWAEINLDAIKNNILEIKKILKPDTKILGVVKADAYGHGFLEVSKVLIENGADSLGVAFIDEAIQLRDCGIDKPILILGHTPKEYSNILVERDIIPSVFNTELAKSISEEAVKQNKTAKIHIKIDTGMTRIGFLYNDDEKIKNRTIEQIKEISALKNIEIDGMFTHFASADEEDMSYTDLQFSRFTELAKRLEDIGINIPTKHVCNSAATIQCPDMQLDMVRPGIILYGLYPSDEVDKTKLNLIPAMQFKACITHIKDIEKGTCISYGRTFTAERDMKIATIPIGYADGFSRLLSNNIEVLVGGKKSKLVGRICMDQCMIDITNVNNVNVGDEVVIFGSQGDEVLPVDNISNAIGTINYEMLCIIGKRIPRVYTQKGKISHVLNYLLYRPLDVVNKSIT